MLETNGRLIKLERFNLWYQITCLLLLVLLIFAVAMPKAEYQKPLIKESHSVSNEKKDDNSKHPTKEEWLNVYLVHAIRHMTDSWEQRIGIMVVIVNEEKQIVVTLGSANGQKEISLEAQKRYEEYVTLRVKGVLEDYEWAKGYKVTVQYN